MSINLVVWTTFLSVSKVIAFSNQKIWSVCNNNGSCSCGPNIYSAVLCSESEIKIQDCYCMFYDQENGVPYVGRCPFSCIDRVHYDEHQYVFYSVEHYSVENASLFNDAICE